MLGSVVGSCWPHAWVCLPGEKPFPIESCPDRVTRDRPDGFAQGYLVCSVKAGDAIPASTSPAAVNQRHGASGTAWALVS